MGVNNCIAEWKLSAWSIHGFSLLAASCWRKCATQPWAPGYNECNPRLLLLENRRKIEPNKIFSCWIPRLLVSLAWQLEILFTALCPWVECSTIQSVQWLFSLWVVGLQVTCFLVCLLTKLPILITVNLDDTKKKWFLEFYKRMCFCGNPNKNNRVGSVTLALKVG